MKKSLLLAVGLVFLCLSLSNSVFAQQEEVDHSYSPLTLKLKDDNHHYVRFLFWHQQWMTTSNLSGDGNLQIDHLARRSRVLAFAQVSPKFLILTHFGLNSLGSGNMSALGTGDASQIFLHDAWGEFKVSNNSALYLGGGLHYWKGLTRMANQSTLNFMTLDNTRPFAHWHSLGVTDQFARHMGIYAKGNFGKFDYRLAFNNPINPSNSLGAGRDFSTIEGGSGLTYTGAATPNSDNDEVGNAIIEGYFRYNLFDTESTKLPYNVGTYLGKKKVLALGAGFFTHPNGMFNTATGDHESVSHIAADVYLDMPIKGDDCLNAYVSVMNYNYGDNYVSRWAGTGSVLYGQVGYLLPQTKFMPYIAYQNANYDGFDETVSALDVGVNYFINGHHAKLTLEYHQITNDVREGAIQDFGPNNTLSQIRLQAHIFL